MRAVSKHKKWSYTLHETVYTEGHLVYQLPIATIILHNNPKILMTYKINSYCSHVWNRLDSSADLPEFIHLPETAVS